VKRHDSAEYGLAFVSSLTVLGNNTWSDLDFLPQAKDTRQDGSTSDTTF
jgi:hypothetical protein